MHWSLVAYVLGCAGAVVMGVMVAQWRHRCPAPGQPILTVLFAEEARCVQCGAVALCVPLATKQQYLCLSCFDPRRAAMVINDLVRAEAMRQAAPWN